MYNDTSIDPRMVYLKPIRVACGIIVLLLTIWGTIGTAMSIFVLVLRKPCSKKIRLWFVALSITDLCRLLVAGGEFAGATFNERLIRDISPTMCHMIIFLLTATHFSTAHMQAGIAVYRAVTLSMPFKHLFLLHHQWFRYFLVVIIGSSFSIGAVVSGIHTYNYTGGFCDIPKEKQCYVTYFSFIVRVLIPNVLILLSGGRIIYYLIEWVHQTQQNLIGNPSWGNFKRRHHRATLVLLCMILTYMIGTLPYDILYLSFGLHVPDLRDSLPDMELYERSTILEVVNTFSILNFSTNWMFYLLLGREIRQAFRELYCPFYSPSEHKSAIK